MNNSSPTLHRPFIKATYLKIDEYRTEELGKEDRMPLLLVMLAHPALWLLVVMLTIILLIARAGGGATSPRP
jgi:hypothetical protein